MSPLYGQVVAGPPGSGKTTYCTGMQEYLRLLGRQAFVINLDPANERPKSPTGKANDTKDEGSSNSLPYDTLLDVCESVVNLSSVMRQLGLGPNGGLVYCMEYLEAHVDELVEMIRERAAEHTNPYLLFDLPGQVELYSHTTAVPRLLEKLVKVLDLRLVAIQLIDSHYCTEPANFLSAALLGTTTMLRLELPTVSVLSKIDLLANYGPLPFSLDYFTECYELERLLPFLNQDVHQQADDNDFRINDEFSYADDSDYQEARRRKISSPFFRKHEKLHRVLAEVVDEFGLLSFLPLDISDAESVGRVLAKIDKCNGYIFLDKNGTSNKTQDLFQCAVQADHTSDYEAIADIEEKLAACRENNQQQQELSSSNQGTIFEKEQEN